MQKLVSFLLIFAFLLPVPLVRADNASPALDLKFSEPAKDASFASDNVKFAALDSADFVPVEKKLISEQKSAAEKKTTWWKWAIGAALVIGVAAAAGGGGGGGSSAPAPSTGSTTIVW